MSLTGYTVHDSVEAAQVPAMPTQDVRPKALPVRHDLEGLHVALLALRDQDLEEHSVIPFLLAIGTRETAAAVGQTATDPIAMD